METNFESLRRQIVGCTRCPRLVAFREQVPIRPSLNQGMAWRKPIPGSGDEKGWLLIVGLAPSAQGANRTGRMFTGDESARFLIDALYRAGFASQPTSTHINDGLRFHGCYLTAAVKCVPPQNRPTREEFIQCSSYFENELFLLTQLKAVLALGMLAFNAYQGFLKQKGVIRSLTPFAHGQTVAATGWPTLYGAYHPSPQNTYTGKLTATMFLHLLHRIRQESGKSASCSTANFAP